MSSAQDRARRAAGRQTLLERLARLGRSKDRGNGTHQGRDADQPSLEALERRVEHLESELEGLQDAMHRDSVRQNKLIEDLDRRTQPGAMSRSLGEDARRRGI